MRYRELYIITIGFIVLGLGLALLNPEGGTSFFIFPFFFAGELAPMIILMTLFAAMMCFWWVNKTWVGDARFDNYQETRPLFLRVASICQVCGAPLPENASYCSSCGSAIDDLSF